MFTRHTTGQVVNHATDATSSKTVEHSFAVNQDGCNDVIPTSQCIAQPHHCSPKSAPAAAADEFQLSVEHHKFALHATAS
jgi:hypothetical protein